jgi:hypothetical protein
MIRICSVITLHRDFEGIEVICWADLTRSSSYFENGFGRTKDHCASILQSDTLTFFPVKSQSFSSDDLLLRLFCSRWSGGTLG